MLALTSSATDSWRFVRTRFSVALLLPSRWVALLLPS